MRLTAADLVRAASAPCLLLRDEDVEAVRAKVDAHRWARRAFRKLREHAQTQVAEPVRIPDRGGQWPHWYACQECGTQLETESPTVHRCPACGLVNSGEPWDSVPLTAVHNRLSEDARDLAVYYALSGEAAFAGKAAEILLGYAEAYPHYPIRDHHLETDTAWATKVSWGTLGEAVWLIPICIAYDLVRHADILRPADHQAIREQLLRPAARLILKHNIGIHNIQCWHNCAIGMAGLMLRDADLVGFAVDDEVGIRAQLAQGVLPDGMWFEGSWGYHFYGMKPLLSWALALRNAGMDLFPDLRAMFEAPLAAVMPDGGMPAFHDSGGAPLATQADHYEIALAAYDDDRFAAPLREDRRDSLYALIFGVAEPPTDSSYPDQTTRLPESGFVFCRQGSGRRRTYLALDHGPHGGWHGHPDKLSFTLFGRERVLAPDPGSIAYGVPLNEQWYKQTLSHNTVVVDGKSQAPATGKANFVVSADGLDVVQADAGDIHDDVRFQRTLAVGQDVVIVVDRLRSEHVHTYDWVYHNRGSLRTAFPRRKLKRPLGDSDGYEMIEDPRRGRPDGAWRATWKLEGAGVRLTMAGSKRESEVYSATGPANVDTPGIGYTGESVPFVIARRAGRRRTTFAAALQVFGSRPAADSLDTVDADRPERCRAFRYVAGDTDLTLAVALRSGEATVGGVLFHGAALVIDRGRQNRVILCDGDRLGCFGRTVTLSGPGSVEVMEEDDDLRLTNLSDGPIEVSIDGRETSLPAGRTWRMPASN